MNCLLTCFKVLGCQSNSLMKSEHKMLNHHEDHREGRSISTTTVEKMGMVCISATTATTVEKMDILEMAREEVLEDK